MVLTVETVITAVTPPYIWRADFIDECWLIVRRGVLPVLITVGAFSYAVAGLTGGSIVSALGAPDRLGGFFVMATLRELGPWVTAMTVAGVAGAAVCADIGARKVRQELDAMSVMGLDLTRSIVVPRFLALGIMTPLMTMLAMGVSVISGLVAAVVNWGSPLAGFTHTFTSNLSMVDVLGTVLKTGCFGFIIAIVSCYKGMQAKGGPEGVGRAVNQAVVITFTAIWAFNFMFTATMLAAFPEAIQVH